MFHFIAIFASSLLVVFGMRRLPNKLREPKQFGLLDTFSFDGGEQQSDHQDHKHAEELHSLLLTLFATIQMSNDRKELRHKLFKPLK